MKLLLLPFLGAVGFTVAAILLTIVAAAMTKDRSLQGAYVSSLFITVPIFAILGAALGVWLAVG